MWWRGRCSSLWKRQKSTRAHFSGTQQPSRIPHTLPYLPAAWGGLWVAEHPNLHSNTTALLKLSFPTKYGPLTEETVIREWNIKVHHTFISRSFSWKGHVEGWKNRFVEAYSCNRIQILFEPVGYQNAFYLFSSLMKYSERQLKVLLTAAIWAEETPSICFYVHYHSRVPEEKWQR